ncbi:OmpA family protein [Dyadobacter psychrotolerans]|uniref:Flagellar motor protein MotB n=1 Tax=Dyadobacter psychrotolerans TaxID=2541721 RepID=A0A4R5DV85_9BACT|nr:OmpA family protein [Dyadobacter psychrotolerans]TDE18446.1 flagellar motor protein MotB [Dyadobacter psychrotolerans]
MICKKSLKWVSAFVLICICFPSYSQNQWTYDFNNGLNAIESGGPALKVLGVPGKYVKEPIPDVKDLFRTTYRFEKNSGLQFNNAETEGFLNKSFTVEVYFKLDTLGSWKRVLDFKNRKSDYGSYIYDGKLNFYDFAISEKAPVRAKQYIHYVYSRDFETKTIKMYINGLAKLEFKDPGTEGVLDQDQVLNFFQDDLIANHESSSGSVALIRVYDRVMTPVFVRRSYQTISKVKQPEIVAEKKVEVEVKPAVTAEPVKDANLVTVSGKVFDGRNLQAVENVDVSVRDSKDDALVAQTKTVNGTYQVQLRPYESYKISVDAPGFQTKSVSVKTNNKSEEVKSLISLAAERYDRPFATILFTQSLEVLESEAKTSLDSMASFFQRRTDLKLMLKGHTDNIGDFDKNIELSRQRVETVRNYLNSKGIPNDRIEGVGYGPTRPSYKNQSEEQKRLNRRVEVWAEPIKR